MKTTRIVSETIAARHEFAGVTVHITDGAATAIKFSWYSRTRWENHSVSSVAQLRGMQTALGEILAELQERGLVPLKLDEE